MHWPGSECIKLLHNILAVVIRPASVHREIGWMMLVRMEYQRISVCPTALNLWCPAFTNLNESVYYLLELTGQCEIMLAIFQALPDICVREAFNNMRGVLHRLLLSDMTKYLSETFRRSCQGSLTTTTWSKQDGMQNQSHQNAVLDRLCIFTCSSQSYLQVFTIT